MFEILLRTTSCQFISEIWLYWGPGTSWPLLGQLGPKWFIRHYSGATHWIFTNSPSFCLKFCYAHQAALVCFRNLGLLGAWDIVTTLGQMGPKWFTWHYSGATRSTFTKTPQFVWNFVSHTKLLASLFQKFGFIGGLGPMNTFRAIGSKMVYLYSGATHSIFSNNPSFCLKFCFAHQAASLF